MGKRKDILEATKSLFWENGYEATSPRDILDLSKAGQGSFYHHFGSKKDLAVAAMEEVAEDRIRIFDTAFASPGTVKERLRLYLAQRKHPLVGCRIGRMVWDSAIKDERLRAPLEKYFRHVQQRLIEELEQAVARKELQLLLPPTQLALLIIVALQGSFTVSRALQSSCMEDTVAGLQQMLDVTILER